MKHLIERWLHAKESERIAVELRRDLEDQLCGLLHVQSTLDGTQSSEHDGYTVKVVGRIERKVDGDKLQELASEHGLSEHLSSLCRWKPELNMVVWKATDEAITKVLAPAITAKPGRPSFSITLIKKD